MSDTPHQDVERIEDAGADEAPADAGALGPEGDAVAPEPGPVDATGEPGVIEEVEGALGDVESGLEAAQGEVVSDGAGPDEPASDELVGDVPEGESEEAGSFETVDEASAAEASAGVDDEASSAGTGSGGEQAGDADASAGGEEASSADDGVGASGEGEEPVLCDGDFAPAVDEVEGVEAGEEAAAEGSGAEEAPGEALEGTQLGAFEEGAACPLDVDEDGALVAAVPDASEIGAGAFEAPEDGGGEETREAPAPDAGAEEARPADDAAARVRRVVEHAKPVGKAGLKASVVGAKVSARGANVGWKFLRPRLRPGAEMACRGLSWPLRFAPEGVRDLIGVAGIVTLANGVVTLVLVLVLL